MINIMKMKNFKVNINKTENVHLDNSLILATLNRQYGGRIIKDDKYGILNTIQFSQEKENQESKVFEIAFIKNQVTNKIEPKFITTATNNANEKIVALNYAVMVMKNLDSIENAFLNNIHKEILAIKEQQSMKLQEIKDKNSSFESEQLLEDERKMDALENREWDER